MKISFAGKDSRDDSSDLVCPKCGDPNVHFEKPDFCCGCDNYKAWEGRGDAIKIPMWCECFHKWTMIIGHHKGVTTIKYDV